MKMYNKIAVECILVGGLLYAGFLLHAQTQNTSEESKALFSGAAPCISTVERPPKTLDELSSDTSQTFTMRLPATTSGLSPAPVTPLSPDAPPIILSDSSSGLSPSFTTRIPAATRALIHLPAATSGLSQTPLTRIPAATRGLIRLPAAMSGLPQTFTTSLPPIELLPVITTNYLHSFTTSAGMRDATSGHFEMFTTYIPSATVEPSLVGAPYPYPEIFTFSIGGSEVYAPDCDHCQFFGLDFIAYSSTNNFKSLEIKGGHDLVITTQKSIPELAAWYEKENREIDLHKDKNYLEVR
jgi:hypothetical protein